MRLVFCSFLTVLAACSKPSEPASAPRPVSPQARELPPPPPPTPRAPPPTLPPTRVQAPGRVVAIGDLHGDVSATRAVLRAAGVLDAAGRWSGGDTTVVQTGDQLDRGDDEREILELLDRLATEAHAAGGALYPLNGNHEIMNVQGDFRYVTPGGFRAFGGGAEGRREAFAQGGPWATRMAAHNTVMVVNDTVFVHGGLLPSHVTFGLEPINRAVRDYMAGVGAELPTVLTREDSPVWLRVFAMQESATVCGLLEDALQRANARRLVIGHTVQQQGINSGCAGKVWRIDVGLAALYNGPIEALELPREGPPRVLRGAR